LVVGCGFRILNGNLCFSLFGLLSLMDVMLGVPVADLIEALPLRKEMKEALCGESTLVNIALRLFESYEDADWEQCMNQSLALQLTEGEVAGCTEIRLFGQRILSTQMNRGG
jgi:c-di-GMP-related signal transduction protein